MICNDNISFENLKYFKNTNLKNIILECPEFDVLLLHQIYNNNELSEKYTKLDDNNKNISELISYIISKRGVVKLCKLAKYNLNSFSFKNIVLNKIHKFLYNNLETYVYKYNYITKNINIIEYDNDDLLYNDIENRIQEINIIKNNIHEL